MLATAASRTMLVVVIVGTSVSVRRGAGEDLKKEALATAKRATRFLVEQVSTRGGYLWRYSSDLKLREGEGVVRTETVWVQPPGTPAVGEAFVRLFQATGDRQFLEAARLAADALRQGQMRSGGWQDRVEFEPRLRRRWAYRTEPPGRKRKDQSSLDDDKTQSAIRFLIRLDAAEHFQNAAVHEMTLYALKGLIERGQFPNGAFPQVWTDTSRERAPAGIRKASYPKQWPRQYPGHREYWLKYTLNDNLMPDVIRTLFLAADTYHEAAYEQAALRAADFLLAAQMPEPQPAWAQQYDYDMHPIWARKFEPPAVTGGESQGVLRILMEVYRRTGDAKYLKPIPAALAYLSRSRLPDGRLARFYELRTNRPLYFNRRYELTYDDADMPTHYGFKVASHLDELRREYDELSASSGRARDSSRGAARGPRRVSQARVREIVESLDPRGAWVTEGGLKYHRRSGPVIEMQVAVRHLNLLADFLAGSDRP